MIWRKVVMSANKMINPKVTFLWWGLFIPSFKTYSLKKSNQRLLWPIRFNKKFEQEKKSLYEISISKSVYVDTYYVLFVIIVTEYVSSNEIFFLTSQKGGGIAGANYLKVKNDVTHWITIVSDRNQIHAAPNFLFLSS